MTTKENKDWHLDKKVPLAAFVMILINILTTIWWAGRLDQNVMVQEKRNDQQDEAIVTMQNRFNEQDRILSRMEASQQFIVNAVNETRADVKGLSAVRAAGK